MKAISAQFKVHASFDWNNLVKSKVQLQVLHAKGWRPLFEFTGQDMMKFFTKGAHLDKARKTRKRS